MSSFIDRKFNSFEAFLRKHFKEECLKFDAFQRVYEIDHDAFYAFYLKILLEKLENLKQKSKPEVSESVGRKLRPGTRSSIPYPKRGLAAIKSGTIPELNLHEMIKDSLEAAINAFYGAIHKDKDLIKKLEESNTDTIKLEELYSIITNPKSDVIIPDRVYPKFDIKYYLKEPDAKFIYPEIRKNIKKLHEDVVVALLTRSELEFKDAMVQYGILPVMYTDAYIPDNRIFDFNNGNGVGLRFNDAEKFNIAKAYVMVMCEYYTDLDYIDYPDMQLLLIIRNSSS